MEIEHRASSLSPATRCVEKIKVLVADDHPVLRCGICGLIDAQPDLSVVGAVADSLQAYQILDERRPDILLLDLELGGQSSYQLIQDVVRREAGSQVVVYTDVADEYRVIEAIRSGARGYVIKSVRPERVYEAIRNVGDGGSYLDPAVASRVMGRIGRLQERRQNHSRELTEREREVLSGLAAGKRNREIATELYISERTVKYHVKSMFRKLRASNRTQVVRIALQYGLI